jgi:hypothetical protein
LSVLSRFEHGRHRAAARIGHSVDIALQSRHHPTINRIERIPALSGASCHVATSDQSLAYSALSASPCKRRIALDVSVLADDRNFKLNFA